jgi:protein-S-isoprenylcysteine O-methyltransferase Ste14
MSRTWASLGAAAFLAVAPGSVAGLVPWLITRWRVGPLPPGGVALRIVGSLLIVGGLGVLLDSFARFAREGRGTPAPVLPTRTLVVTGLYRHVRNPMYVAVVGAVLGQALLLANAALVAYAALVWLAFHAFVLGYEEPTLRRSYGAEYEAFCAAVPRWIPRLRPWRSG